MVDRMSLVSLGRARARVILQLGPGGVVHVGRTAIELARMKRSLEQHGLRESIEGGEYAEFFAPVAVESLTAPNTAPNTAPEADEIARRQSRIVRIAAKRVGATCLPQSIVLARRLRNRGLNPSVRIGVADLPTIGMAAHAWVELNGKPVGEDASSFASFGVEEFGRALGSLGVSR
jgi:hypothetical protein